MNDKAKKLAFLLKKAQKGDKQSLQNLCKELEEDIRGYFQKKIHDPVIVDDLCQETYLKLLNNILTIKSRMKLRHFVTKVAFHVMQDYFRKVYRSREESLETDFAGQSQTDIIFETKLINESYIEEFSDERIIDELALQEALNQFPKKTRTILMMRSQGYTNEEISAEVGLSLSGVKMRVKRSLEELKFLLLDVTFFCLAATTLMRDIQLL